MEIAKWNETFENADTRKRQRLGWLFIPTGCDSNGYLALVAEEGGFEAFGIFLAICQWSATQPRELRGKLVRTNGEPLTEKDIAVRIRAEACQVSAALKLLMSNNVGWITGDVPGKSASNLPAICQSHPDFVQGEGQGEGQGILSTEIEPQKNMKPARLSSETYDVPPPTVLPEEGRQAGDPEFSEKDSKAPMTEAAWLTLAGKMSIDTAFAVALYAEMDAKGWIDNDGKPVAFLAQFLRASWQREQARRDQSATKPTNGKREPWMIEADIKRAKAEIARIQNDRANLNHGGHGPSLESHKAKFEDAWLAELRALREEVRHQLPAEYAAFEREHVEHVAAMLKDGVLASTMDDDYALSRLAERMPEELPSFERWDREWNRANAWKDPEKLTAEARQMVKQLRGHLAKLEAELQGVMVAV